jgi:hypothetical protein
MTVGPGRFRLLWPAANYQSRKAGVKGRNQTIATGEFFLQISIGSGWLQPYYRVVASPAAATKPLPKKSTTKKRGQ